MSELLSTGDIAKLLGVTRDYATDKLTKKPDFPKPRVSLSQKLRRWAREDVEKWMAGPKESRNGT